MKPAAKMGQLLNGSQRDQGYVIHLVPDDTRQYGYATALCGTQPGRRSGGWDVEYFSDREATCDRCAKKAQRAGS